MNTCSNLLENNNACPLHICRSSYILSGCEKKTELHFFPLNGEVSCLHIQGKAWSDNLMSRYSRIFMRRYIYIGFLIDIVNGDWVNNCIDFLVSNFVSMQSPSCLFYTLYKYS